MSMHFTSEQERALVLDRHVAVMAGAGSGKTRVLVERYLRLLDANPDWPLSAVVAITFTEKAAGEMLERVRLGLERRLKAASTPAERQRWSERLGETASTRISTIHALCAALLRANAAEAGVDPAFEVMDETGASLLRDRAYESALKKLAVQQAPALKLFTLFKGDSLRDALLKLADSSLPDSDPEATLERWYAGISTWMTEEVRSLRQQPMMDPFRAFNPDFGVDTRDKLWPIFESALAAVRALDDEDPLTWHVHALRLLDIKVNVGSQAAWGGKDNLDAVKDSLKALREYGKRTADFWTLAGMMDQFTVENCMPTVWTIELARTIQTQYRALKDEAGVLDFNDLESKTADLLASTPAVAERYRGKEFKALLVDEFQDTNASQWQIVEALADWANPGALFVVGDAKQSIYAFRGADVSVFRGVQQRIVEVGGSPVPLTQSFRTHQRLVTVLNGMFAHILGPDDAARPVYEIGLDTEMNAHRSAAPCEDGVPVVEFILPAQSDEDDDTAARAPEARLIAQRIAELVADEAPVQNDHSDPIYAGKTRPVRYGDVVLLFRSMTDVTVYEQAFKDLGLPYLTLAGRGFYDRQEVWDLINLLRALANPLDDLSLASALHSPLFNLSDEALLRLRLAVQQQNTQPDAAADEGVEKKWTFWDALLNADRTPFGDERGVIDFAARTFQELRALNARLTIGELLREALRRTGYLAVLTGLPDGDRRRGNIDKLLAKADSSGQITLGAFTRYITRLVTVESREGESEQDAGNAVRLMTIHASKGLEFPVVVVADTARRENSLRFPALMRDPVLGIVCKTGDVINDGMHGLAKDAARRRDEAEMRRLLYVAATRARDYLIFSATLPKKTYPKPFEWLAEVFELVGDDLPATIAFCPDEPLRIYRGSDTVIETKTTRPAVWTLPNTAAGDSAAPPLLPGYRWKPDEQVIYLSATQLEHLGGIHAASGDEQEYYRRLTRRSLVYDAPHEITQVMREVTGPSARAIGSMVHRALFTLYTDDAFEQQYRSGALVALLESFAWEEGIVTTAAVQTAVWQAMELLERAFGNDSFKMLAGLEEAHREIPFDYRRDRFIVQGVIDVLFQNTRGGWTVVDYKTTKVKTDNLEEHARRYALQLAIYAEAVRQMQGHAVNVETYIYYVLHAKWVVVTEDERRQALDMLPDAIQRVLSVENSQEDSDDSVSV